MLHDDLVVDSWSFWLYRNVTLVKNNETKEVSELWRRRRKFRREATDHTRSGPVGCNQDQCRQQ